MSDVLQILENQNFRHACDTCLRVFHECECLFSPEHTCPGLAPEGRTTGLFIQQSSEHSPLVSDAEEVTAHPMRPTDSRKKVLHAVEQTCELSAPIVICMLWWIPRMDVHVTTA